MPERRTARKRKRPCWRRWTNLLTSSDHVLHFDSAVIVIIVIIYHHHPLLAPLWALISLRCRPAPESPAVHGSNKLLQVERISRTGGRYLDAPDTVSSYWQYCRGFFVFCFVQGRKAWRKGMKEDRTVDKELKDISTERIRQKKTEKQERIQEWMRERKQI